MDAVRQCLLDLGPYHPWALLVVFVAASFLLIWRLEHLTRSGVEGTVLGTLVMPYCSGLGNLIFVFVVGRSTVAGTEVMTNCLVNNVTNMTLLIGLPAALWGLSLAPPRRRKRAGKRAGADPGQQHRVNRLALLLTLTAVFFFTGAVWALGRDGRLDSGDGLVLVGLFLFWQCFHVFDVLKTNARQNRSFSPLLLIDLALLLVGAFLTYVSIDGLVTWLQGMQGGFFNATRLGWLSGWLMVLPNGLLALYYAWKGRAEVVYSSQVGDGHICIPLCVGLYALLKPPLQVPPFFEIGIVILAGATLLHVVFVAIFKQIPRVVGWALAAAYGVFLYTGLVK